MNKKYYIEIDPINKEKEILDIFKDYNARSFSKTDNGYDWLEEDTSKCVVIPNPHGGEDLEINVGDIGEFTIYFSANHAHYASCQGDYEEMIRTIQEILNNDLCSGIIKDTEGKWYGSRFVNKADTNNKPEIVFDFVFKKKEFRDKLMKTGYYIEFVFWDPANSIILGAPSQNSTP